MTTFTLPQADRAAHRAWLDPIVAQLRPDLGPAEEGVLWLLMLDAPRGRVRVASAIPDGLDHVDDADFAVSLRSLAEEVPVTALLVSVHRPDGHPMPADRRLAASLQHSFAESGVDLADVVVVGNRGYWSARSTVG